MQDALVFLSRLSRRPDRIGAIAPSGPVLGRFMAREIDPALPGLVVELGGGTGGITRTLLAQGVEASNLVIIERDRHLHAYLKDTFPQVGKILRGHAASLRSLLGHGGQVPPVKAVISGLPLLNMRPAMRARILAEAFSCLVPGGAFIQFTYGLFCPVPTAILKKLGLRARIIRRVWLNFPPSAIWRFEKLT
ncbi:MAG: SAM-dependent methyltransferase [Alphaproteobacteria bacterium]|nr:SAM-dependent methyltransferase [Alphaproteobacteria bacterium]